MTDAPAKPARKPREQAILHVEEAFDLPSGLRRVIAGGPGFARYQDNAFTDRYVKLLIADPATGLEPPYDMDALRAERPADLPVRRTYTVRHVDAARRRLALDFVIHGDEGVAGPWAKAASGGEVIAVMGAGGGYAPDPDAEWHLLVGDLSALPAIEQAIERLRPDARGHVVLDLPESAELGVELPAGVMLHRFDAHEIERGTDDDPSALEAPDPLLDVVAALEWGDGAPHAFVHGERGSMKRLRRLLLGERGVPRERLSLSAYWARGRTEDRFQDEKREPIGKLGED